MRISEFIHILQLAMLSSGDDDVVYRTHGETVDKFSINIINTGLDDYLNRMKNFAKARLSKDEIETKMALDNYTGFVTLDEGFTTTNGKFYSSKVVKECELLQEFENGKKKGEPRIVGTL